VRLHYDFKDLSNSKYYKFVVLSANLNAYRNRLNIDPHQFRHAQLLILFQCHEVDMFVPYCSSLNHGSNSNNLLRCFRFIRWPVHFTICPFVQQFHVMFFIVTRVLLVIFRSRNRLKCLHLFYNLSTIHCSPYPIA
jgi:hypothetical protein